MRGSGLALAIDPTEPSPDALSTGRPVEPTQAAAAFPFGCRAADHQGLVSGRHLKWF